MHARRSLLFDNEKPWVKRNNELLFDVSRGSFNGAEVCELVGLFLLNRLYRDDVLAAFKNMGPRTADKLKKGSPMYSKHSA